MKNIDYPFANLIKWVNGRKIVLYGMGLSAIEAVWILNAYGIDISFFVDQKADTVSSYLNKNVYDNTHIESKQHYVIIIPAQYTNPISQILLAKGLKHEHDFCTWDSLRGQQILLDGVKIGKHTHGFAAFSDCLGHSTKNYIDSIGSFVSINKTAMIGADHLMRLSSSHEVLRIAGIENKISAGTSQNRVLIGSDVWIGAHVFINASKVHSIGNGAVIGTGAVVIEDVPAYSIVAGVPAKVKKYRFSPKQIEVLQNTKWWEWSDDTIRKNARCFYDEKYFFQIYTKK